MARKKKLIWFEREAAVGRADEARQRGTTHGAPRGTAPDPAGARTRGSAAFYGPLTLEADGDDPVGAVPDGPPAG